MIYKHDCSECSFLGSFKGEDLYFCPNSGATLVIRFGDDGPDYSSVPVNGWRFFEGLRPEYGKVHELAVRAGLIKPKLPE